MNTDTQHACLPAAGYVRQAQLIPGIIPVSSPTLWRWCKAGHFPKPVKLGPRVTAWDVAAVRAWIEQHAGNGAR